MEIEENLAQDTQETADLQESLKTLQGAAGELQEQQGNPNIPAVPPIPDLTPITDGIANAQENLTESVNNASANIQEGLPGAIENLQTQLGAFMRGRSVEEEAAWRQGERDKYGDANEAFQEQMTDPLSEGIRSASGGTMDAIESVGDFAELTGDTFKTKMNEWMGKPVDQTQNPFSPEYIRGDGGWLDIPDELVPENRTALGKLTRGFVEFGVLLVGTRGVGNAIGGGAGISTVGTRAAGVGGAGNKAIQFLKTTGAVAAEGAAAELIMDDEATLMNLVDEHADFLSPTVKKILGVNALKVNPDDNPWLAKLKVLVTGAGFNLIAHTIGAFAKGKWAARQARKGGSDVDSANEIGNIEFQKSWLRSRQLDEVASTEMAADRLVNEKKGIPLNSAREDYVINKLNDVEAEEWVSPNAIPERKAQLEQLADERGAQQSDVFDLDADQAPSQANQKVDPFVNPRKFNDSERATVRPDADNPVRQNLKEAIIDAADGGEGRSYSPLMTEAALRKMSRGDANIREYIVEVANDISNAAFKDLDNTLDQKALQRLAIKQAADLHDIIANSNGQEAVKRMQDYFRKGTDGIEWMHDGNKVVTGNASQKIALQLVTNTLMKQASAIARGALSISDELPINRQVEQVFDQAKVALIEHKKISYMTGTELAAHKGTVVSSTRRKQISKRLAEINAEEDELFENLSKLYLKGEEGMMDDLMELYALSDGNVRSMNHVHEFLKSKLRGGDMGKGVIAGQFRQQLGSTFYNSILSALKTPIDAIASTTMIATSRPAMQWVGAAVKLDRKEMAIAFSGLDALGNAWKESIDMAKYNWDLSLKRKNQTYMGRYDQAGDISNFKSLAPYYAKYGDKVQQRAYSVLNTIVDINTSPWMKYSANAMGAGDALARTVIGRMSMRMAATREAIEKGVDFNDAVTLAKKTEANFRRKIFKKNADNMWVVSDKATMLAGDEATMTKALEGYLSVFEGLQQLPAGRIFFPFVRTGVNALDLTFQHSPAGMFHAKYRHLKKGLYLDKYGLNPNEVAGELAMMEGRIAIGSTVVGIATLATLNGNMTGDYPYNKTDRDLWIARGIKPYSFKFWNPITKTDYYVSYEELEPFNTLFSVAANLAQNAHILGEDVRDHWGEKLIFMTAAVFVDKSFLSGVKDLASLVTPQRAEGQFMKTFTKFGRSHLPYAGLLGELGTIMDANGKEANTFMEMMWKRDAIWKSMMYPKYDILAKDRSGKKLNYAAENGWLRLFNALSPVAITPIEDDPVKQALVDMRFNLPDEMKHVNGQVLTSKQRSELSKYMSMGPLRKDLARIVIHDKNWRKLLDEYKERGFLESKGNLLRDQAFYQPVKKAFARAKKLAWAQVLANNPELREQISVQKAKANLGKKGAYNHLDMLNKAKQHGY